MPEDRLTITLGPELRDKLQKIAKRDKRAMAYIVRQALEEFVKTCNVPGEQVTLPFESR